MNFPRSITRAYRSYFFFRGSVARICEERRALWRSSTSVLFARPNLCTQICRLVTKPTSITLHSAVGRRFDVPIRNPVISEHVDVENVCDQPLEVLSPVAKNKNAIQISYCLCAMADTTIVPSCGLYTFDPYLYQHNAPAAWSHRTSEAGRGVSSARSWAMGAVPNI